MRDCAAVVMVNAVRGDLLERLRPQCDPETRFLIWTGHAYNQPSMAPLAQAAQRDPWDGFVMVSNWQARTYAEVFGISPAKLTVLRNAVSPAFENLLPMEGPAPARPWPPVLAYTSTPFRGLDRLLEAFPLIRRAVPGTRLKVFSDMSVYFVDSGQDQFQGLYQRCRDLEGVEYVGALDQPRLAQELKEVSYLSYPNTFAETSCIAVMEALAAGCRVVTSELGALPETLEGLGRLVPASLDPHTHVRQFAAALVEEIAAGPLPAQRLHAQVERINCSGTWQARARQWEEFLARAPRHPGAH
jgi:glycosyltransferase involved in cell wall biosynthesis